MKNDVLFINPGDHKKTYQDLSKTFTAIATPMWTSLLANRTRRDGYATAIYDVNVEGWGEHTAGDVIQKYNPNLIVIMVYGHNPSASTQTMPAAGRIAEDIKNCNRDVPVAMGGIHPSALPERTMSEEKVDYVIQGEGVYTIQGLINFTHGREEIVKVPGLWFRENGKVRFTCPAPIVENLDEELDGYAFDLLPTLTNYRAHTMHCFQEFEKSRMDDFSDVRSPYVALNTSLGCPYSCHYCCINAIFGRPRIRYWSLDKVLVWIDELAGKYGVKNIRFDDELFIFSPKRVETFCDRLIERGYDLNIWVYGRVDTIRVSLLKKMKKAGFNWICLGIESGNTAVRNGVNKSIKKDIGDIVRSIQAHGIYVLGNFMFGLPQDTMDTMNETLKLAMNLNCEFINFYCTMAYPGSKLFEEMLKKGGRLPDSWEAFSQHSYHTQPLLTNYLTSKEVLKFRDNAFYTYFQNPEYIEMITAKFGQKVREHLNSMLQVKITRKTLEN